MWAPWRPAARLCTLAGEAAIQIRDADDAVAVQDRHPGHPTSPPPVCEAAIDGSAHPGGVGAHPGRSRARPGPRHRFRIRSDYWARRFGRHYGARADDQQAPCSHYPRHRWGLGRGSQLNQRYLCQRPPGDRSLSPPRQRRSKTRERGRRLSRSDPGAGRNRVSCSRPRRPQPARLDRTPRGGHRSRRGNLPPLLLRRRFRYVVLPPVR